MATITLDQKYRIETDAYNFTLKYENKYLDTEKGKEITQKDEWHFPSLSGALNKYSNEVFRIAESVGELRVKLSDLEKLISTIKL